MHMEISICMRGIIAVTTVRRHAVPAGQLQRDFAGRSPGPPDALASCYRKTCRSEISCVGQCAHSAVWAPVYERVPQLSVMSSRAVAPGWGRTSHLGATSFHPLTPTAVERDAHLRSPSSYLRSIRSITLLRGCHHGGSSAGAEALWCP